MSKSVYGTLWRYEQVGVWDLVEYEQVCVWDLVEV